MDQNYSWIGPRVTMPKPRRLWDSCVIIDYLAGTPAVAETCSQIIAQAERGELEIVVSTMAAIEVAYLTGIDDQDSEAKIKEFFGRNYIIPVSIDIQLASLVRDLVRRHKDSLKIKPPDATHLATAQQWNIPLVETTDTDLLRFNRVVGNPSIIVRRPLYEGTQRLPGIP